MDSDLPSTPEGRLLRAARESVIPKLTIRAAAAKIGMSPEQWGYAERGHTPGRGGQPPKIFHPPAATLARMARSLGIAPDRLESEGQRPDAAGMLRSDPAPSRPRPVPDMPDLDDATDAEIDAWIGATGSRQLWLLWNMLDPQGPEGKLMGRSERLGFLKTHLAGAGRDYLREENRQEGRQGAAEGTG